MAMPLANWNTLIPYSGPPLWNPAVVELTVDLVFPASEVFSPTGTVTYTGATEGRCWCWIDPDTSNNPIQVPYEILAYPVQSHFPDEQIWTHSIPLTPAASNQPSVVTWPSLSPNEHNYKFASPTSKFTAARVFAETFVLDPSLQAFFAAGDPAFELHVIKETFTSTHENPGWSYISLIVEYPDAGGG